MNIDVTNGVVKFCAQNLLSMRSAASTVTPSGTIYRSESTWDHQAQTSVVIHACQCLDHIFVDQRCLLQTVFSHICSWSFGFAISGPRAGRLVLQKQTSGVRGVAFPTFRGRQDCVDLGYKGNV